MSESSFRDKFSQFSVKIGNFLTSNAMDIFILSLVACEWLIGTSELLLEVEYYSLKAAGSLISAEKVHAIIEYLHVLGFIILSFFVVEIISKAIFLGIKHFAHISESLDASVVMFSLVIELVVKNHPSLERIHVLSEFIILLRFWRVFKLIRVLMATNKLSVEAAFRLHLNKKDSEIMQLAEIIKQQGPEFTERIAHLLPPTTELASKSNEIK